MKVAIGCEKMKWFRIVFVFSVVFALSVVYGQASDEQFTPIWRDEQRMQFLIPPALFWSADSRELYFTLQDPISAYRYHIADGEIYEAETSVPTIQLTSEQQEHFRALNRIGYVAPNQDTFVYISTSQSYSLGEGGYFSYLFAVGNLNDKTFKPTGLGVQVTGTPRIRWSDDSTAFIREHDTVYGSQVVVSPVKSLDSCGWRFCAFYQLNPLFMDTGQTIYDLSPDGRRILYRQFNGALTLWDIEQNMSLDLTDRTLTEIPVDKVIGAAFSNDDDDEILLVNDEGIMRYHLLTGQTTLTNPHITSDWASWVMFSPDNQWAAVLADGNIYYTSLFVLPVEQSEPVHQEPPA